MKKSEKIATIMTDKLLTVDVSQSLTDVNLLFANNNIRHIPVVLGETLIGIISQTDIMRMSFGNIFNEDEDTTDDAIFKMLSINQIMKKSPVTIKSTQTIRDAAKILAHHEFHALPVVDDGKLIGMVTTTDIIQYFLHVQHESRDMTMAIL
jgi:CBS domain-containing protein